MPDQLRQRIDRSAEAWIKQTFARGLELRAADRRTASRFGQGAQAVAQGRANTYSPVPFCGGGWILACVINPLVTAPLPVMTATY